MTKKSTKKVPVQVLSDAELKTLEDKGSFEFHEDEEMMSFLSEDEFTLDLSDSNNDDIDYSVFDEELELIVETPNDRTNTVFEERSDKFNISELDKLFEIAAKAIDRACHEQELYKNHTSNSEREYHLTRMSLAFSIYFRNYLQIKLIETESRKKEAHCLEGYMHHDEIYKETFAEFKETAKKIQGIKIKHGLGLTDNEELEFILLDNPFKKTESKKLASELLNKSDTYFANQKKTTSTVNT
ncbi:TPA: hypothetical protein ACKROA_003564 [Pseudomonas aeruginosa]